MNYTRYGGNSELYQLWEIGPGEPSSKVIMEGEWKERHFVICAHHSMHPNGYVEVKKYDMIYCESEQYGETYDGRLNTVHGGSTYFGKAYWDETDKRLYVGWDYSHLGDFGKFDPFGKKYTLIDVMMDISAAITEIELMNEDDPEYYQRRWHPER